MFLCYLRGQDGWRHLIPKVGLRGDLGLGASALCYAAAAHHGVYILSRKDNNTHKWSTFFMMWLCDHPFRAGSMFFQKDVLYSVVDIFSSAAQDWKTTSLYPSTLTCRAAPELEWAVDGPESRQGIGWAELEGEKFMLWLEESSSEAWLS